MTALPPLDLTALAWFLICWVGYAKYYEWRSTHRVSLVSTMDEYRLGWMRAMCLRENRMMDETLTGNLLRSITFFASTSILLVLGLLTLLKYPTEGAHALTTIPYVQPAEPFVWECKSLLLVLIFIYAFFKYTWSLRQYNYTCILIGAAPHHKETEQHEGYARRAAAVASNAARHFNLGLRAYYFGFAAMSWFLHPLLFILTSTWVVFVVYRRECRSLTLGVLSVLFDMQRLVAVLLSLLFALPAYAFDACAPDGASHYTPIVGHYGRRVFFKIEKCGLPDSYILGTFHSDDPKYYNSLPLARDAIKTARVAVFEYIQPTDSAALVERYMYLTPGKDLRGLLGEERFHLLLGAVHKRFPAFNRDTLNRMQPWAAAVILQFPPQSFDGVVLDDRFKHLAEGEGKKLKGLETMESQFQVFAGLTTEQQLAFLNDALDFSDEGKTIEDDLEKAYTAHDLSHIEKLVPQSIALSKDPAFANLLLDRLLYSRNKGMTKASLPLLAKGSAFIAVGALHLPGKDGLLRAFENAGYFIEPVE